MGSKEVRPDDIEVEEAQLKDKEEEMDTGEKQLRHWTTTTNSAIQTEQVLHAAPLHNVGGQQPDRPKGWWQCQWFQHHMITPQAVPPH
jgi:hypothetical protein